MGQRIRKVESDSSAEHAGLKAGDRIISVNGMNVEKESHQQVVARIKEKSGETELLVVDEEADKYYSEKNIPITEDLLQDGAEEPATPPPSPKEEAVQESGNEAAPDALRPKLCHLDKGDSGYGFNLHSEKGRQGRFIRSVDPGSPAEESGLRAGDRIIEINGINLEYEKHSQVVAAIKESGDKVNMLVVDEKTDAYFQTCKVTPTAEHLDGELPSPAQETKQNGTTEVESKPEEPEPTRQKENTANDGDLFTLDLTQLKEATKAKKKAAPSSNWNNRQAIFNNL